MRTLTDLVLAGTAGRLRIIVADGWGSRAVGLLATRRLDDPCGLWLKPCHSIHTFWMRYAIDVLFLDEKNRVMRIVHSLKPWRFAGCRGARTTLELRAGLAAMLELRVGMELRFQ
jgi:uncharacterized membrane protein (UPF0127 family)